eukprot:augustus_masked-scaffold_32-processed-gene-2.57-mRNA-1 protein AED:1.00 eAED:1.00 QI:0/-1/0/0/-1/1/1/0/87
MYLEEYLKIALRSMEWEDFEGFHLETDFDLEWAPLAPQFRLRVRLVHLKGRWECHYYLKTSLHVSREMFLPSMRFREFRFVIPSING